MAECVLLEEMIPRGDNHRPAQVALVAAAAVTGAGVLAVRARQRREGELAQVRIVAEAVQQVLLRPVPRQVGSVSLEFGAGDQVLFCTDGVSEARCKAGEFFPLARRAALLAPSDPGSLVDRLSAEVTRHVGHAPDDDVALLLAYRRAA
jgi:serine phosphatase RsbU (regulator of sigma subunit)